MEKKQIKEIFKILKKQIKKYDTPLAHHIYLKNKNKLLLLISIILSARTNDKITLKVMQKLQEKIKNTNDLKNIKKQDLEKLIYPVGFYKNKAIFLKKIPDNLKKYNNKIPNNQKQLLNFNGVGKKTANLYLSIVYNKDLICVDTHVHKISNRLGLVTTKNPEQTEIELMKIIDKKYWKDINEYFVLYGQNICLSINPKCNICKLKKYCFFIKKNKKN